MILQFTNANREFSATTLPQLTEGCPNGKIRFTFLKVSNNRDRSSKLCNTQTRSKVPVLKMAWIVALWISKKNWT